MVRKISVVIFCLALFPISALADELIFNGGFETPTPTTFSGIPNWVTAASSAPYIPSIYNAGPGVPPATPPGAGNTTTGIVCAIGNINLAGTSINPYSYIQQSIDVPRDALGTTLTFYYEWYAVHFLMPNRTYLDARFGNKTIWSVPSPVPTGNYQPPPLAWTQVNQYIDLSLYGGQKINLQFRATNDNAGDPNFMLVDGISLDVITATKTNTPTISPTPSITPTITVTPTVSPTPTRTPTSTITPTRTITPTITPWVASTGEAPAFPNPARGGQVTFIYSLESPADIAVDIFNALGFKVAHLEDNHKLGASNQQTTWNIQSVAPGVYLYQVTVKYHTGQVRKMKIQRVAIVK